MPVTRPPQLPAVWLGLTAVVLVPVAHWDNVYRFSLLPQTLVLQILVLLGLAALALSRQQIRMPRPLGSPVTALMLVTALSILVAGNRVAALSSLNVQIGCVFLFVLLANGLGVDGLKRVLAAGATAASLLSILGLAQYFGWAENLVPTAGLPSATLGHRNLAAAYLMGTLPFAVYFYADSSRRRDLWMWGIGVGLQGAFLVATRSRGAWVAAAVAASLWVAITFKVGNLRCRASPGWRQRALSFVVILVLIAAPAVVPANIEKGAGEAMWEGKRSVSESVSSILQPGGDKGRLVLWRRTLEIIADRPIMGIGAGNWRIAYPAYAQGDMIEPTQVPHRPHNSFLSVWSETGTVGLVAYLWLIWVAFREGARVRGRNRLLATALLCSLTAVLCNSVFSFPREFPATWIPFYVTLAGISALRAKRGERVTVLPGWVVWPGLALAASCVWLTVAETRFDRHALPLRVAVAVKDWPLALQEAHAALDVGPFDEEAYLMRGLANSALGAVVAARQDIEAGLYYNPNSAGLWIGLGNVLRKMGERQGAFTAFRRAMALDPGSGRALSNVGTLHASGGELDSAVAAYEQALDLEPDLTEARANLSIAYRRLGLVEEAVVAARKAIAGDPGNPEALASLGGALTASGQHVEAGRAFEAALRSDPKRLSLLYNLAASKEAQGDSAGAVQAYRRFLASWRGGENPFVVRSRERLARLIDRVDN
jgi:O-antigen ligase/Flp pilus assembly protein TadD